MKTLRILIQLLMIISFTTVNGQIFEPNNPSVDLSFGAGISSYYGDLIQSNPFFKEPSYCFSTGIAYNHNPHLTLRGDFSYQQIQAQDSKNKRPDLIARNLSFKSQIWNIDAMMEYNVIDITANNKFTPYAFLGFGVCHFNPYTKDRNGKKVYLQPLGTEGQGLALYPDRLPYATTILEVPFGIGFKYAISSRLNLAFELKYHYVDTDHLDDVSNAGYPDQAALAAKNPSLPMLTYRGDELPGGAPYPSKSSGLNRGNPNNRDAYYNGQFKINFRLHSSSKIEIDY